MFNSPFTFVAERRRWCIRTALAIGASVTLAACGGGDGGSARWVASWAASPQTVSTTKTFANQTVRQLMYVSAGGDQIRVRVSNVFGTSPLVIDSLRVARSSGDTSVDVSTDRPVKFSGQERLSLAAGQEIWSDPIDLAVAAHGTVAVSAYVSAATPLTTGHGLGQQNNYVGVGNVASAATFTATETNQFYAWVTGLDVSSASVQKVVVAFGDSITDGFNSTVGQNNRYPNYLSRLLRGGTDGASYSVVNEGISGNRWIFGSDANPPGSGRFSRDVLAQSGITHAVFMLGINDIGIPSYFNTPAEVVSAEQIFAAMVSAADAAKSRGIKVFAGTLSPMKISIYGSYYSEVGEAKRQAVNAMIRQSTRFDGIIDFDLVLRDPADASILRAAFDSGDHIHPSDAGYEAMAKAAAAVLLK